MMVMLFWYQIKLNTAKSKAVTKVLSKKLYYDFNRSFQCNKKYCGRKFCFINTWLDTDIIMVLPFEVKDVFYQQVTLGGSFSCPSPQPVVLPPHTIDQLVSEMSSSPVPQHLYNYVDALCTDVPRVVWSIFQHTQLHHFLCLVLAGPPWQPKIYTSCIN